MGGKGRKGGKGGVVEGQRAASVCGLVEESLGAARVLDVVGQFFRRSLARRGWVANIQRHIVADFLWDLSNFC